MGTTLLRIVPIHPENRSFRGCQATVIVAGSCLPFLGGKRGPVPSGFCFLRQNLLGSPFGFPEYLPGRSACQCMRYYSFWECAVCNQHFPGGPFHVVQSGIQRPESFFCLAALGQTDCLKAQSRKNVWISSL